MNALRMVISGGQTGVDWAALRAANDCGLDIGGWCPPGRESDGGTIPTEFPLKETPQERSAEAPDVPRSQRTEWNVRDSDGTLVIVQGGASHSEAATDAGTKWAMDCARAYGRPLLTCDVDDPAATKEQIRQWIVREQIKVLNVAGPSETTAPGIGDRVFALLREVFRTGN